MCGIIIYGPAGCGKTRNAQTISNYFGLPVLDGWSWDGRTTPPSHVVALTNDPTAPGALQFHEVMATIMESN